MRCRKVGRASVSSDDTVDASAAASSVLVGWEVFLSEDNAVDAAAASSTVLVGGGVGGGVVIQERGDG